MAVGKKFVAAPEVWKIVEGTLYLNLDKAIQSKWNEDIPGYIKKADAIRQCGDAYNRSRLTPTVKGIFNRLMAYRR
jgi:hypothetical protein